MLLSRSVCDDPHLNRTYSQSPSIQRLMPTNEDFPFPTSSWDTTSSQHATAHGDAYPFYPRPPPGGFTEASSRQNPPAYQSGYYGFGFSGASISQDPNVDASLQAGHSQQSSQEATKAISRVPSRSGSTTSSLLHGMPISTEASPVLARGVTALPINEVSASRTDPRSHEDDEDSDGSDDVDESGQLHASGHSDSALSRKKMKRFRLTHSQSRFLTAEFAKQPHPDAAHREYLSTKIPGLSPRQVQVWFQNRRAKMKRHTQSDRDRILQMRAVPDGFDTVQALQSPYGAVPQPIGHPRTSPFPSHHHPQIRTPIMEVQPGAPMMMNEMGSQSFRGDTMHSPVAGDQGIHVLRTRRDDRSNMSSPSYFPPGMPTSVPQDPHSMQQNFNYWQNPMWTETTSPVDSRPVDSRSAAPGDTRLPWSPSMGDQDRKPPIGQSDQTSTNIPGALGIHQHHPPGFDMSPVHAQSQELDMRSRATSANFATGAAQHRRHPEAQHPLVSPVRMEGLRQQTWPNAPSWEASNIPFSPNYTQSQYPPPPPTSQAPQPLPLLQNEGSDTREMANVYQAGQTGKPARYNEAEPQGLSGEQATQESNLPYGTQGYEV